MNKPSITIFGIGRVGGALKKSLSNAGYPIHSTFTRNTFPESEKELGEVIFITTHDKEIADLANKIALKFPSYKGKYVIHCSGTLDSKVLQPLSDKGAMTASFHPLKAVTKDDDSFAGVWFDMDGEASTIMLLEKIAKDLKPSVSK